MILNKEVYETVYIKTVLRDRVKSLASVKGIPLYEMLDTIVAGYLDSQVLEPVKEEHEAFLKQIEDVLASIERGRS
jgi:hypothetical protein